MHADIQNSMKMRIPVMPGRAEVASQKDGYR